MVAGWIPGRGARAWANSLVTCGPALVGIASNLFNLFGALIDYLDWAACFL